MSTPIDLPPHTDAVDRHRARRGTRGREDGAIAVEFALVLPILLTIVFGIVQYGWYFYSVQAAGDVARDAARRAAVSDPVDCAAFRSSVLANLTSYTNDPGASVVTRAYTNSTGSAVSPAVPGNFVEVSVGYQSLDFGLPFIPLPGDGYITTTAEARVESVGLGVPPVTCA